MKHLTSFDLDDVLKPDMMINQLDFAVTAQINQGKHRPLFPYGKQHDGTESQATQVSPINPSGPSSH